MVIDAEVLDDEGMYAVHHRENLCDHLWVDAELVRSTAERDIMGSVLGNLQDFDIGDNVGAVLQVVQKCRKAIVPSTGEYVKFVEEVRSGGVDPVATHKCARS